MKKKYLAMMCAAAMLSTALVGCGNNNAETTSGTDASTDDAAVTTVESGKLVMSTNAQFPPYEMVADGEGFNGTGFEGIDIEIANAIAEKMGLELVVNNMGFDACLLAVQNGGSDIAMAGITVNEERLVSMDFSNSYANGVQAVIVAEDSAIKSLDDLAGKMIGGQRATTGVIYATDEFGEEFVTAYDDAAIAVQALLGGKIDCVIIDQAPAKSYVEANPGLKLLDTEYANEDYAIAVNKGNTAMLDAVNAALAELTEDGTVGAIVEKYIPAEG